MHDGTNLPVPDRTGIRGDCATLFVSLERSPLEIFSIAGLKRGNPRRLLGGICPGALSTKQGWYASSVGSAVARCGEVLGTPVELPP
jgi:hypothetical protein